MPSKLKRYQTSGHDHFITFSCYRRLPYLDNYDFNVLTQPKFFEKLRYIHRDPVTRGLVENAEDWPGAGGWPTPDPHYIMGAHSSQHHRDEWAYAPAHLR